MMRQYELVEKVQAYNPHADENLLNKAYVYAMQKHGAQKRASGDPFFNHPLEVASILTDLKLDDATIAVGAAPRHHRGHRRHARRDRPVFGPEIGEIVDGLTKIERLQLVTREEAQAENLRKLLLAISADVRVLLVKLADRLHNMRTLDYMPAEKQRRIAEETMDIYAPLAGRMGMQDMRSELENLAFRTLQPDHYAAITGRLAEMQAEFRETIETIKRELTAKLSDRRDRGEGLGAGEIRVVDRHQDRAQADRARAAFRHDRLPRDRADGRRLLPRAGDRPHQLEGRAGPLQGLHLRPQAQ